MSIRTLGADHRFVELSSESVAARLRARDPGAALSILALSGGGAGGAFGAGALVGLTRSGTRPQFDVVTGVSAGALVAPYAFLGPDWDAALIDAYTNGLGEHLLQPRLLGAIWGSSVYRGEPLRDLVDHYVTTAMIAAVAQQAAAGRLLLIVTTDVDTGQPVVWDLGAIAMNGEAEARTLFRDLLVASASVPGMFPPVIVRIQQSGAPYEEAHVDGGVTVPFLIPDGFLPSLGGASPGTPATAVYVIIEGRLGDAPRWTPRRVSTIVSRSVSAGLNRMTRTTLELTASMTRVQGARLQYSAIPVRYPSWEAFDFHADAMRSLFHYGYQCAATGRLWISAGAAPGNTPIQASSEAKDSLSCPTSDAFVVQVAAQ
jgi:hypothetical protein